MSERLKKSEVSSEKIGSPDSGYESLESEERFQLEVVQKLKPYFAEAEIVVHQRSGKEIAHIYFDHNDENSPNETVILLDLLDIFPWKDELRNELLIDSSWDIEKLILLGLLPSRTVSDIPGISSEGDASVKFHRFGSFTTPRMERPRIVEPQPGESDRVTPEHDAVVPVHEYIERDYLDEPEYTEALILAQGKYTTTDTARGVNFLRTHSRYKWQTVDGDRCLLRRSDKTIITKEEQLEMLRKAQNEIEASSPSSSAKNEVLHMHVGLVYFVLNNLLSAGFRIRSFEDTLQEGLLGLQRAIELYDLSQQAQFSTYAVIHIEARMRRFCLQDDLVRIPHHTQTVRTQLRNEAFAVESVTAHTTTLAKVAEKLGLEGSLLEKKLHGTLWNQVLEPIEAHIESLVDELHTLRPDQYAEVRQLSSEIDNTLRGLPPRLEKVIRFRFGVLPGDEYDYSHTLDQIADVPGIRQYPAPDQQGLTRERIRQLEAKALRHLRHPSRSEQLRDFLFESVDNHGPSIHPNNKDKTTAALHDRKEIEE